jgi:hypothetical protein
VKDACCFAGLIVVADGFLVFETPAAGCLCESGSPALPITHKYSDIFLYFLYIQCNF